MRLSARPAAAAVAAAAAAAAAVAAAAAAAAAAEAAVVVLAQDRCPICLEPLSADVRILACGHKMCVMPCYKSFMNLSVRPTREGNWNPQRILRACVGGYGPCLCPLCRAAL